MRLGLVGASTGGLGALARAIRTAVEQADRVVYLADDDAFDDVLAGWVAAVGAEGSLAERARIALEAPPDAVFDVASALVAGELTRRRLLSVQALRGQSRTVEILLDRVILLAADKSELDEEDLLPASVIAFGRGEALVRRVGSRVFLAPGPPSPTGGVMVLAEEPGGASLSLEAFSADGALQQATSLDLARAAKLRVQGAVG